MNKQELVEMVRRSGVVGAGGAGFPTHVKLASAPEWIIVNGAECEPLLRVDQQLLRTQMPVLRAGIQALKVALDPHTVSIAVKAKHAALIAEMKKSGWPPYVRIVELDDYYPAGDELLLVREVTGRTVGEGGIPLEVGVVVINVETLYNVARALDNAPVTEKFVTVAGAVREPRTVRVPLGVPVGELVAMAGGATEKDVVLIDGGPMMGRLIEDPSQPVAKTTKGVLVLPAGLGLVRKRLAPWAGVRLRASQCEMCRACTDMCPRYLLGHSVAPHLVMRSYVFGDGAVTAASVMGALLCVECGVCENYACPTDIFPRRVMAAAKAALLTSGARWRKDSGREPRPREFREERRVPSKRLIARLGLAPYDVPAPLAKTDRVWKKVVLPLKPPFGAVCLPVVKAGDLVHKGDLVGEIDGDRPGSRIHASIGGRVTYVDATRVVIESGVIG